MDSLTEQLIQTALSRVQSTRVTVAHRLSTVMDSDNIVVMKVICIANLSSMLLPPVFCQVFEPQRSKTGNEERGVISDFLSKTALRIHLQENL